MRTNNYLIVYISFVVVMALVHAVLIRDAWGGVDINVYWIEAAFADFSTPRYLQEPVSWLILKALSNSFERDLFPLSFVLLIFVVAAVRLGLLGGVFLYVAFFSPFGTLLELNVLRQCLSTVFLIFAVLSYSSKQYSWAVVWGGLAVLSHNSALIICAAVALGGAWISLSVGQRVAFLVGGGVFFSVLQWLGVLDNLLSGSSGSFSELDNDGLENAIYLGIALFYAFLLYVFGLESKWKPVAAGLAGGVCAIAILVTLFNFGTWVYGRMAISVIVICQFLLIYEPFELRFIDSKRLFFCLGLILGNALLILLHPGARDMITNGLI